MHASLPLPGGDGLDAEFVRLTLLRPIERFLTRVISISTEPAAFVGGHIRLGDTTNFLRAAGFFVSAISTAFLAKVATVLVGAAFALVASAVVRSLVDVGYIPDISFDFNQWGEEQQSIAVLKRVLYDCLKNESLLFTVVASGLEETYTNLRSPIDDISYLRPVISVLYLFVAAPMFMAAVARRKPIVTVANYLVLKAYLDWKTEAPGPSLKRQKFREVMVAAGLHWLTGSLPELQRSEIITVSSPSREEWRI